MNGMTQDAFGELLDKLYYGALDTRDQGDKFERLMRSYLLTDQAYSFSKVWLWNEYPERGDRSDIGVDLVGVRSDTGEKVAIQCKFKDPEKVIAKGDIDSFISASATAVAACGAAARHILRTRVAPQPATEEMTPSAWPCTRTTRTRSTTRP